MVTSVVVVVGSVVDGVVDSVVVVVRDDAGVEVRVVVGAGALPPLPRAKTSRPKMMTAIRVITARPHSARTHRFRYHGDGGLPALNRSVSSVLE